MGLDQKTEQLHQEAVRHAGQRAEAGADLTLLQRQEVRCSRRLDVDLVFVQQAASSRFSGRRGAGRRPPWHWPAGPTRERITIAGQDISRLNKRR